VKMKRNELRIPYYDLDMTEPGNKELFSAFCAHAGISERDRDTMLAYQYSPDIQTLKSVAEEFNVSSVTVYNIMRRGNKRLKIAGRKLVESKDPMNWSIPGITATLVVRLVEEVHAEDEAARELWEKEEAARKVREEHNARLAAEQREVKRNADERHLKDIEKLTQIEACKLWRFAPPSHPYMVSDSVLFKAYKAKFEALGGMTPEISKLIGWEKS
jgi:predicted DNA-binding protein YlxM (UPF0122 family)